MSLLSDSDLIQVTTSPALPSRCCICNNTADGEKKFLDWDKDLDYYGAIVLCEFCAVSVGQAVDMVPIKLLHEAAADNSKLMKRIAVLESDLNLANLTLDNLLSLRPDLNTVNIPSASIPVLTDEAGTRKPQDSNSDEGQSDSGPNKPSAKSKPTKLSSTKNIGL